MRTVTLREHETAEVRDEPGEKSFTVREAETLDRTQKFVGVDGFRWTGRNQVKTGQYVGIIAAPSIRLEILPKIDDFGLSATRKALIRMLAIAGNIPVHDGEITGHDYQDRDLLEFLIVLFANRLQRNVRSGLSRSYNLCSQDLLNLRGKLNVARQFTKLAASPQTIACHFDEFTADIALNRLLLCALRLLRYQSRSLETQRLLNEVSTHFADVQSVPPAEALISQLSFNRANKQWKMLAGLARLFLSSIYQTAHAGPRDGVAVLFDMNLLFESYVSAVARRTFTPLGYTVRAQGPRRSLARDESEQLLFQTIPDLHLERGEEVIVLDTKWKRVDVSLRDFDVSQTDAYQMFGYAQTYRSRTTILLFPHHQDVIRPAGIQAHWTFEVGGSALVVATIDIAEIGKAESTLRQIVMGSPE